MEYPRFFFNTTLPCTTELSPTVVFFYQQAAILLMAIVTSVLLKPLGIPPMVSQFLSGVMLGPTFLGHIPGYADVIFPATSIKFLFFFSRFGMVLQMLYIGLLTDPTVVMNSDRKVYVISITVLLLPLVLTLIFVRLLYKIASLDANVYNSLWEISLRLSMNSLPVIACYLHELKIMNSEFSHVAFSCALISGNSCFFLALLYGGYLYGFFVKQTLIYGLITVVVVFLIRPAMKQIIDEVPRGEKVYAVIMIAFLICWVSTHWKVYEYYGVILFGMIIPVGSPLGTALVKRLHFVTTWVIMPVLYTFHGLAMDMTVVKSKVALYTQLLVLISWIGKFVGTLLPALYYNMSFKEATLLGITMNTQGFTELEQWGFMYMMKVFDYESFNIICGSILVMTGCLAPVVQHLYKSTFKYKLHYTRNIQYSRKSSKLRIMACLFDEANVPSIIHILKAISHPEDSPVIATVVHFIELVGLSAPSVVSHIGKKVLKSNIMSQRILNVFTQLEENDGGIISVHPYTVTTTWTSMNIDVCTVSIKERSSLIILPFHEQPSVAMNTNIRTVNCNVLKKAPCSVGLVIDRGHLGGLKYVFENWISYRVVVLFFDGVDDCEALALGERMLGNPTIDLTVFRFCKVGDEVKRTLDEKMIKEFRVKNKDNDRMTYIQKEVNNGVEIIRVIEKMQDIYELVILGRRHDENSPLLVELTNWNTYPELGTLGDIFVTSNYGGNATMLVMQSQLNFEECR